MIESFVVIFILGVGEDEWIKKRINIFVKHLDINKIVSIFAARKEIE